MGGMETVAMMIGDYSVGDVIYFIVKLAGPKIPFRIIKSDFGKTT
jgi:hypothetical protein